MPHNEAHNVAGKVGRHTRIGRNVFVGPEAVIGRNCNIQGNAFIPSGVTIEDGCFIGPGATFCNAKQPPMPLSRQYAKTTVGAGSVIGANATILPGLTLPPDSRIGAGAVLTSNPAPSVWYIGNPARPIEARRRPKGRETTQDTMEGVFHSGRFLSGNYNSKLAASLEKYLGRHVVTCASGTDALYGAAVIAAGSYSETRRVLFPPISFCATYNAISRACPESKFVFCDLDKPGYPMPSPQEMARVAVEESADVIVVVHLFGFSFDTPALRSALYRAGRKNVVIIEDCAQSFGSRYPNDALVGTCGDIAAFSLFPSKNLNTCGDGGFVACNPALAGLLAMTFSNGRTKSGSWVMSKGINSRLSEINAAFTFEQLAGFSDIVRKRKENAAIISAALKKAKMQYLSHFPEEVPNSIPLVTDTPHLLVKAIPQARHYYPYLLSDLCGGSRQTPFARKFIDTHANLPCHPGTDIDLIIKQLKGAVS